MPSTQIVWKEAVREFDTALPKSRQSSQRIWRGETSFEDCFTFTIAEVHPIGFRVTATNGIDFTTLEPSLQKAKDAAQAYYNGHTAKAQANIGLSLLAA